MSFYDSLSTGLLGTPENYGGLLSNEELQRARSNAMTTFGAQLLAASGPSTTPVGLGSALGNAVMSGRQAQQQNGQQMLQTMLLRKQLTEKGKKDLVAVMTPNGPQYIDANDAIGKAPYNLGTESKPAATIQEYNLYHQQAIANGQQPIPFQDFLRLRTDQVTQTRGTVQDVGAVPTLIATTGPKMGNATPLTTLPQEAKGKATVAAATESAKTTAEKTATASFDLPRLEQNAGQAIGVLDQLDKSPGLKYVTGAYSKAPVIPGTKQAEADALAQQVEGKTFLEAFNTLRGGGAITEREGEKATAAIGRLQRSQSTADYQNALRDLRGVIKTGLDRARQQAGKEIQPSGVKHIKVDAHGNEIGS